MTLSQEPVVLLATVQKRLMGACRLHKALNKEILDEGGLRALRRSNLTCQKVETCVGVTRKQSVDRDILFKWHGAMFQCGRKG